LTPKKKKKEKKKKKAVDPFFNVCQCNSPNKQKKSPIFHPGPPTKHCLKKKFNNNTKEKVGITYTWLICLLSWLPLVSIIDEGYLHFIPKSRVMQWI